MPDGNARPFLEIRLFGPFSVRVNDVALPPLRTRKGQWLLALLALRSPRVVSREWLASLLWPDSLEEQALGGLRRALTDLRSALGTAGDYIEGPTARTLRLNPAQVFIDALAFDEAVIRKDEDILLSLYRGTLLEDCSEEWAFTERLNRQEKYIECRTRLACAAMQRNDFATAALHWRPVAQLDPLREVAQRGLMEALARQGEYTAAIQVFSDLRARLRREYSAEPSTETVALLQAIRSQAKAASRVSPAKLTLPSMQPPEAATPAHSLESQPSTVEPPYRVPRPMTHFIGREKEVASLVKNLAVRRLITLSGIGGIGKTRIALATADYLRHNTPESFTDGIFFVDLAPVKDAALVSRALASVLEISEEPGQDLLTTLRSNVSAKRLLLILDNCEHLLEVAAFISESLLKAGEDLRILATSREPLRVFGETVIRVPPLCVPTDRTAPGECQEAIRLFVERAEAIQPDFQLTPTRTDTIIQICERLDGIALAIELAAARLTTLSVEQIAARLDDRFQLLSVGSRTALPRQRTLRAALDWSYDLLADMERVVLQRLSVFTAPFSLELARSVCLPHSSSDWETLELVSALVEKSLVVPNGGDRYRLIETVREYASRLLIESGEQEPIVRRFAETIGVIVREAALKIRSGGQREAFDTLATEVDHIRRAMPVLLSHTETVLDGQRTANIMVRFFTLRNGLSEAEHWGRLALNAVVSADIDTLEAGTIRARLLGSLGVVARRQGNYSQARCYQEESLALGREIHEEDIIATALGNLALLADNCGDYERSQVLREEGLAQERRRGDKHQIAMFLHNLGNMANRMGDYPLAHIRYRECIEINRELGNVEGTAWATSGLADVILNSVDASCAQPGDRERLIPLRDEALTLMHEIGDTEGIVYTRVLRGASHLTVNNDCEAARTDLCAALEMVRGMEGNTVALEVVETVASYAEVCGDLTTAIILQGAVEAIQTGQGTKPTPYEQKRREEDLKAIQSRLSVEAFDAAFAKGHTLTVAEALSLACATMGLPS